MDPFLAVEITSRSDHTRELLVRLADDARLKAPRLAASVMFVLQALDGLLKLTGATTEPDPEGRDHETRTCDVSELEGLPITLVQRWLADTQSVAHSLCQLVELADGRTSESEFVLVRTAVGRVLGYLYTEIEAPLWAAFPDLVPKEMQDGRTPEANERGDVGAVK